MSLLNYFSKTSDGSVGKGICHPAWWPGLVPGIHMVDRKDQSPTSYPQTSHMHHSMYRHINKNEKNKL